MLFRKPSKPQNRIDTLIGAGTRIEGDITFSGGLRIDGEVRGNVRADGDAHSTLVVAEHASIEGDVTVSHAVINGTVTGPLRATEFLELLSRARVTGDVEYNSLELHLGAVISGRLVHTGSIAKSVELKLASSK
jgi:cytoskeletal protein CcmA (bactofilin family)